MCPETNDDYINSLIQRLEKYTKKNIKKKD